MIQNKLSKKMIFTISLLFLFSIAISNVCAAEININNNDNLGQKITNADDGDTINLNIGTYTNGVNNVGINKNIILKGNGPTRDVIIDAQGTSRIFIMGNGINVKFINITFINGKAFGDGGAILNTHTNTMMTFINCSFINNSATNSSSSYYDGDGGAIYNKGHDLNINSSSFTNNRGNYINSEGGAIYNSGHDFIVYNSIFTNNTGYDGGAIFNFNGERFTIINSQFINNFVIGIGYGGAIHNYGRDFSITNSSFTNNNATGENGGYGGAIDNSGVNFSVTYSNFTNNNAPSGVGGGYGGAIYNSGNTFSVKYSNFIGNNASVGGAIINRASARNSSIINSTFINNTGFNGGAISNEGANFTVANSTFTNNKVDNIAGALSNSGANLTVVNSNFTNNSAGAYGGALRNTGGNCSVTNSTFIANVAATNGGGIHNSGNMTVSGNTMTGNEATLGKMIYNSGKMGILKLTFIDNATMKVNKDQIITLYATLTDDMGNTVTGQNIRFIVNGTTIGNVASVEGFASLNYTIPDFQGVIPVSGNYLGHTDDQITLLNGQLSIPIPTNTTIVVPENVKVGETVNISGVLRDEDGNTIGNVELNVNVNGKNFIVNTNDDGQWSLLYTATQVGVITVIATFEGNDMYLECENSTFFNVENVPSNETNTTNNTKNDTEDSNNPTNPTNPKHPIIKIPNPNNPTDPSNPNIPEDTDDKNSNNAENNNRLTQKVPMKETGIPAMAILLMVLSIIVVRIHKKQK